MEFAHIYSFRDSQPQSVVLLPTVAEEAAYLTTTRKRQDKRQDQLIYSIPTYSAAISLSLTGPAPLKKIPLSSCSVMCKERSLYLRSCGEKLQRQMMAAFEVEEYKIGT